MGGTGWPGATYFFAQHVGDLIELTDNLAI
jgi:hypothetical protein